MKYNEKKIVELLIETDPTVKEEITKLEEELKCSISVDIEKINALQYTFFYELLFDEENPDENTFFAVIESGINNGTALVESNWDSNPVHVPKVSCEVADIILDKEFYKGSNTTKAEVLLAMHKKDIFEYIRKNNYDNYVTGGNSKLKEPWVCSQLRLEYIYKIVEVDRNIC